MHPRKTTIKTLENNGFGIKTSWRKPRPLLQSRNQVKTIPVKRHDFNENDMKYIFKEAGIQRSRG